MEQKYLMEGKLRRKRKGCFLEIQLSLFRILLYSLLLK